MKPMLTQVLEDLAARKGGWMEIVRELEPDNAVSFYSWLTKLAQGVIKEPSVNRIQRLYDYFREKEEGSDTPRSHMSPLSESGPGATPESSSAVPASIAEPDQTGACPCQGGARKTAAGERREVA